MMCTYHGARYEALALRARRVLGGCRARAGTTDTYIRGGPPQPRRPPQPTCARGGEEGGTVPAQKKISISWFRRAGVEKETSTHR
jgi:hypothetical protein